MVRMATILTFVGLILAAASPAQAQSPAASPAAAATWTYGNHPLWGVSAYVTMGEHSVGLRCLPRQRGQAPLPVVGVTVTPGLTHSLGGEPWLNYKFVGRKMEIGSKADRKAKYFESTGTTCAVGFEDFQKGRTLVIEDSAEKPKVLARIPLTGAKDAIAKLIAACPAIKRDMNECGF